MHEAVTRLIGTSNRGFAQQAQEEVRRLFPGAKFTYLIPAEVYIMDIPVPRSDTVSVFQHQKPMFLRHMQPVDAEMDRTQSVLLDVDHMIEAIHHFVHLDRSEKIAIQIRKTDGVNAEYALSSMKQVLETKLTESDAIVPVVREANRIISIFVTPDTLFVGVSKPAENMSDWSGGAVRFQREAVQISRSKFKLLEAEQEFNLHFNQFRHALDIGAAPGGWTSHLLECGLAVTAVDPGALHPSLANVPRLTYIKKNASDVAFPENTFDLLVCDMSWNPRQMAKLVTPLIGALQQGGCAIITVKLLHKKPFQTVKDVVELLHPELSLVRAKQLFHNREELTLHMVRR